MSEEIFDVVNERDEVIGQRPRREVHQLGLRHRAVHVLLFNSRGEVFLQKRSANKDTFPGAWDSSSSGHLTPGETYDDCAVREVREELGIELAQPLRRLFKIDACADTDQEFVWVYRGETEGPFILNPEEIERGEWFAPEKLSNLLVTHANDFASALPMIWRIIKDPVETVNKGDRIWQSVTVGTRYLAGVRGAIPFAEEQIALMLRLVPQAVPEVRRFLDLGCGDGGLGRSLFFHHPNACGVFLDFSETMMTAARKNITATPGHAIFITQDFGDARWTDAVKDHTPFDVVVSGFSIHHQTDQRKRRIYEDIYRLLSPGGLFLNMEHVVSSSLWIEKLFDQYFIESLCRYHSQLGSGKTTDQIAQDYYHRPDKAANILASVEDQCQWLRNVGFQHVDCFFKIFELALFGGVKPHN